VALTGACGSSADERSNSGARSTPAEPTQNNSASVPATSGAPSGSPPGAADANAACDRAQAKAVRGGWWTSVWELAGEPTGYAEQVSRDLARRVTRTEDRLRAACGGTVPAEFTRFAADIEQATTANRFGTRTIDRVLAGWLRWGAAVGAPRDPQAAIDNLNRCRTDLYPRVDASYRIWWRWTDTGKAWWIELTIDNRTGKTLWGGMDGYAEATEGLDDPFGGAPPAPGPGRDLSLTWGGSSADILEVRPGTQGILIAPDADTDVHTAANGALTVTDLNVDLATEAMRYSCSIPVRHDLGG
jgi:hypothetical protein